MYEIEEYVDDWKSLTLGEKCKILKEFQIPSNKIDYLLLYDKVVPFWGVLKGYLKDEYEYLSRNDIEFPTEYRDELSIKGYVFYGS